MLKKQNNTLACFNSIREAKRFSKMYALLQILSSQIDHQISEAEIAKKLQSEWAYEELCRMKLPDGFDNLASFEDALSWFVKYCR